MRLDLSSERAVRNDRIATVVAALVFYAVAYTLAWFAYGPKIGFVICTPILGGYLAWLLIHRAESWLYLPKWLALRKINASHHFFDERPLRIEVHDGKCRIAAADVFDVLGQQPSIQLLRRLQVHLGEQAFYQEKDGSWWFEEAAALQWLKSRTAQPDRATRRLYLWLEREAFPALHRKLERGGSGL